MKAGVAIWWPLKNKEIEQMLSYYSILQIFTSDNTKMKPLNFESELADERLHLDNTHPFKG